MTFKIPDEIGFKETVHILTKIYSNKSSLCNDRWKCMNLNKKRTKILLCVLVSPIKNLSPYMSKGLLFVQVLRAEKYDGIGVKMLAKIEQNSNITLQEIVNDCQKKLCLKHGAKEIQKQMHWYKQRTNKTENKSLFHIW